MFLTSSLMTRVLPVPQAISITRAPLAQAFKQSVWQGLKGRWSSCDSSGATPLEHSLPGDKGSRGWDMWVLPPCLWKALQYAGRQQLHDSKH